MRSVAKSTHMYILHVIVNGKPMLNYNPVKKYLSVVKGGKLFKYFIPLQPFVRLYCCRPNKWDAEVE